MKYGERLEQESVPEWSLHNIDYNSLKHEIKLYTTRDQATAITIPGHKDSALAKFEDSLYLELCQQHDRVDLFVGSKANEIGRRLEHVENQIQRLLVRSAEEVAPKVSPKHQRKFAKYERELLRCGEDTLSLGRFINAQIVAFRKITKKHKKWTGSSTLGSRFRVGDPPLSVLGGSAWFWLPQQVILISSIASSRGRGTRAAGWFSDYIAHHGDSDMESVVLLEGIKGWATAGGEFVEWMDEYEPIWSVK